MGNSQATPSKHYQQATHFRAPTIPILLPSPTMPAAGKNLLFHPQVPFPSMFLVTTEDRVPSDYQRRVTISQVKLENNYLVEEKQIYSGVFSTHGGPWTRSVARAIPNGFEFLMSGTSLPYTAGRFQCFFDGTVKQIHTNHQVMFASSIVYCLVKDTYYWTVAEKSNVYLMAWNVETDAISIVDLKLPLSYQVQVLLFTDTTLLLPRWGSTEAYLFDIETKKLSPFPLFYPYSGSAQFVHLNDTHLVSVEQDFLVLHNKKTRQARLLYTGFDSKSSAHLLPRATKNAPFEILGSAYRQAFKITIPASMTMDLGFNIPKDACIQTSNGQIEIHKLILAARIPNALNNADLLNWSFASKSAAEKVVRFLYSGWIDVDTKEFDHIAAIAKHANLPQLSQFLQSIASGTDSKVNDILGQIATTGKKSKDCTIDGISYESLFDAYLAIRLHSAVELARKAALDHPNSLLVERFVKSVEGCSLMNLQQTLGNLERDLATLVFNPLLSDMEIILDQKTYPAHAIFFAESELVNTMQELSDAKLVINMDKMGIACKEADLKQLLTYAYTGTVFLPDSMSVDNMIILARLGFFFGFTELQIAAESWFAYHVDSSNVKQVLEFATFYNCEKIVAACQQFLSPTPNVAQDLQLQMSDLATIPNAYERNVEFAKHLRVENNSFRFEKGELRILAPFKNHSSMTVFNYELPFETGFKICMSFSEPEIGADKSHLQVFLCDSLPSLKQEYSKLLTFRFAGNTSVTPLHAATKGNPIPIAIINGKALQVDLQCVPMKYVDATMDNHLLIATINNVSHSFHVKFDSQKKYLLGILAENNQTVSGELTLKSFQAHFNSNAAKEWVPLLLDMPLTCFRSKCNKMFTLKTNNDMACNAHMSYAHLVDPFYSSDYDFEDSMKLWGCCKKEQSEVGCFVGKHGLARMFE